MTAGMMLTPTGICVPDNPLSPYRLERWVRDARTVAEVAVEQGLGDEVAWAVLLGDVSVVRLDARGREVLRLSTVLAAYKVIYGNRSKRGSRRTGRRRNGPEKGHTAVTAGTGAAPVSADSGWWWVVVALVLIQGVVLGLLLSTWWDR